MLVKNGSTRPESKLTYSYEENTLPVKSSIEHFFGSLNLLYFPQKIPHTGNIESLDQCGL